MLFYEFIHGLLVFFRHWLLFEITKQNIFLLSVMALIRIGSDEVYGSFDEKGIGFCLRLPTLKLLLYDSDYPFDESMFYH